MVSEPEAPTVKSDLPLVSVALKMLPVKEADGLVEMLNTFPGVRLKAEMEATEPVGMPALILNMLALVMPDAEAMMLKMRPVVIWAEATILKTFPVVRPLAEIEAMEPNDSELFLITNMAPFGPGVSVLEKMALLAVNPLVTFTDPANEAEPVPLKVGLPVLILRLVPTIAAALRPLVIYRPPEKDDDPVPEKTPPPPKMPPPVTFKLPAKELEAVPVERINPEVETLPVA